MKANSPEILINKEEVDNLFHKKFADKKIVSTFAFPLRGNSSVGRARPCQGRGREFESRFPLKKKSLGSAGAFLFGIVSKIRSFAHARSIFVAFVSENSCFAHALLFHRGNRELE